MTKKLDWPKDLPLAVSIFMENYVLSLKEILEKVLGKYTAASSPPNLVFGIGSEIGSSSVLTNIVVPHKEGAENQKEVSQEEFLEECLMETFQGLRNKIDEDLPELSHKVIIGPTEGYKHCYQLGATDPVIAVKILEEIAITNDLEDSDTLPHNMIPTKSFYSHKDVTGSFAYNAAAKDQRTKDLRLYHQPLAIYQSAEAALYDAEIITTTETNNLSFSFRRLFELAAAAYEKTSESPKVPFFLRGEHGVHGKDGDPRHGLFLTH